LRTEGVGALFGGCVPRTFAISMGGAIFLGIYDFASHFGRADPAEEAK
jgi:solute carrier family 25 S-adenosylmethionine transporter 26